MHRYRKTYLDLINDCDSSLPHKSSLYKFFLEGHNKPIGILIEHIVNAFTWNDEHWKVNHVERTVILLGCSRIEREARLQEMLRGERQRGTFEVLSSSSGELDAVLGNRGTVLMTMDRFASPLFGIITYGVQLLAYVDREDGIYVWLQRRAKNKRTFPGLLDSTVGGHLPAFESPLDCVIREADEEASIPATVTRAGSVAVGTVSYLSVTDSRSKGEKGLLSPDVRFIYELRLSEDVKPKPNDGEAEEFVLLSIEQLKEVMATGHCTPGNAEVLIDFFVRRGIITFETEPDYVDIIPRLHRQLDLESLTT
ncbi:thiamine pyrophosphokinase-related protein [Xylariales sp. PMI_506]|nr:thiamine pyrophosphokinase-related protein [Xylariales sp. PMI_506]